MKRLLIAATLATASMLTVPPAFAEGPGDAPAAAPSTRTQMMFFFLDRNGDGYIDAEEIKAVRTARFEAMDANGDGVLTRDEATAAMARGHGRGPRAEHAKGGERAEAKAQKASDRRERRQARMLERIGFTDGVDTVTLAIFVDRDIPMLERADADKDGKISREEFLNAASKSKRGMGAPN